MLTGYLVIVFLTHLYVFMYSWITAQYIILQCNKLIGFLKIVCTVTFYTDFFYPHETLLYAFKLLKAIRKKEKHLEKIM